MTKNIGTIDRVARVVVGLLVLALLFVLVQVIGIANGRKWAATYM